MRDVNNVHLVCKKLHQIANLHVNPKFRFKECSQKNIESLVQSSRIFEKLEFDFRSDDYLWSQEKFERIEEYLGFTGIHVKELKFKEMKVNPMIVQKLLNLLPNLNSLELNFIESTRLEEPFNWNIMSTKIQHFRKTGCHGFDNLLGSLEKCAIKEANLGYRPETETEALKNFLKAHKKSLKTLTGHQLDFGFLVDLKDLRLEHLDYSCDGSQNISLDFLRTQIDLKSLSLGGFNYSNEFLNPVWELKNLESLNVFGVGGRRSNDSSGLDNLHRLGKLKRLRVDPFVSPNILDHMKFGVFNNLGELDAFFRDASVESIQEMKRITPNLRKLMISSAASSETFNTLLEALDNLESVYINLRNEWELTGRVYPKMEYLDVSSSSTFKFSAEQFTQQFPNLEYLDIYGCHSEITESFFVTLFGGLKQLKALDMAIKTHSELNQESTLQCFQEHGKHLKAAFVNIRFPYSEVPSFTIEKMPEPEGSFYLR